MTGAGDRPLLVLDRFGEGRVAQLASDHAWLWSRGYEGGGPPHVRVPELFDAPSGVADLRVTRVAAGELW